MDKEQGKALLLDLANVLDQIELPFFLMQGTALGAYRDQGFVPHEKDVDLGILYEDWRVKSHVLVEVLMCNCFDLELIFQPFTQLRTIVAWKYGCKADLVSFASWKGKRFACSPVRPWEKKPYAIVHDAAMLENQRTLKLFGLSFQVPYKIEEYLELEYGPDWRTPKDDHVSRTRVYDFIGKEGISRNLLEQTH